MNTAQKEKLKNLIEKIDSFFSKYHTSCGRNLIEKAYDTLDTIYILEPLNLEPLNENSQRDSLLLIHQLLLSHFKQIQRAFLPKEKDLIFKITNTIRSIIPNGGVISNTALKKWISEFNALYKTEQTRENKSYSAPVEKLTQSQTKVNHPSTPKEAEFIQALEAKESLKDKKSYLANLNGVIVEILDGFQPIRRGLELIERNTEDKQFYHIFALTWMNIAGLSYANCYDLIFYLDEKKCSNLFKSMKPNQMILIINSTVINKRLNSLIEQLYLFYPEFHKQLEPELKKKKYKKLSKTIYNVINSIKNCNLETIDNILNALKETHNSNLRKYYLEKANLKSVVDTQKDYGRLMKDLSIEERCIVLKGLNDSLKWLIRKPFDFRFTVYGLNLEQIQELVLPYTEDRLNQIIKTGAWYPGVRSNPDGRKIADDVQKFLIPDTEGLWALLDYFINGIGERERTVKGPIEMVDYLLNIVKTDTHENDRVGFSVPWLRSENLESHLNTLKLTQEQLSIIFDKRQIERLAREHDVPYFNTSYTRALLSHISITDIKDLKRKELQENNESCRETIMKFYDALLKKLPELQPNQNMEKGSSVDEENTSTGTTFRNR